MPRYEVIEHHAYTLTFIIEDAPNEAAAIEEAEDMSADDADEEELGTQETTVRQLD